MRTRAKQKHVASDRARRENVPRHILFWSRKKANKKGYLKSDNLFMTCPGIEPGFTP